MIKVKVNDYSSTVKILAFQYPAEIDSLTQRIVTLEQSTADYVTSDELTPISQAANAAVAEAETANENANSALEAAEIGANHAGSAHAPAAFNTPLNGQTFNGVANLTRCITSYISKTLIEAMEISVAATPVVGATDMGILVGASNGNITPTLNGITKIGDFNPKSGVKNLFVITKLEDAVYLQWTELP